jgi:hypothetical protein
MGRKTGRDQVELQRLRAVDAGAGVAEYKASKEAEQAKTARLKALRLAKEAADRDSPNAGDKRKSLLAGLLLVPIQKPFRFSPGLEVVHGIPAASRATCER